MYLHRTVHAFSSAQSILLYMYVCTSDFSFSLHVNFNENVSLNAV